MTTETYGNQLKGVAIKINHITSLLNKKHKTEGDSIVNTFRKTSPLQIIRKQIENKKNTNIIIQINEWTMDCHLLVLQCYSEYFKRLDLDQAPIVELPIKRVSPKTFTDIYDWMLTDDPLIKREDIIEIFISACYLEVEPMVAQIWACLSDAEKIQEAAAFFIYLEAALCKVDCVKEMMMKRISKFFLIMVAFKEFVLLPFDDLCFILDSNNIGVNTEIEVFMAAIRWLHFDWMPRKKFLYKLMKIVRFNLIPPGFLIELDRNMIDNEFIKSVMAEPKIRTLVSNGLKYATTQLCYGNIVKQCMPKDTKLFKTKRRWLYDEKCEYHIKSNQLVEYKITYEKFLEYIEFLKESKSDHWEAFIDIKAEDYKTPNYMERREFQFCEVKETRYACVIKEVTETEISHQDLQTSLSNSTLNQQPSRSQESGIDIKNATSSLVRNKPISNQDFFDELSEKSCEITSQNLLNHFHKKTENTLFQAFKGSIESISRSYVSLKSGSQTKINAKFVEVEEAEKETDQTIENCADNAKVELISTEEEFFNAEKDEEKKEKSNTSLKIPKSARNESLKSSHPHEFEENCSLRAGLEFENSQNISTTLKNCKHLKCQKCKCEPRSESTSPEVQSSSSSSSNEESDDETTDMSSSTLEGYNPDVSSELQSSRSSFSTTKLIETHVHLNTELHRFKNKLISPEKKDEIIKNKTQKILNETKTKIEFTQPKRIITNVNSEFQSFKFKKVVNDVEAKLEEFKPQETINETSANALVEATFNEIFTRFHTLDSRDHLMELNSVPATGKTQTLLPDLGSAHSTPTDNSENKSLIAKSTKALTEHKTEHLYKSIFKNKTLLVLGGTDPYNQHANYLDPKYGMNLVDKVLLYNDKIKQWTQLSHTAFGTRHHHATVVCNGLVYIVGGTKVIPGCKKAFFETSIWALNPKTKKWNFETNLPKNRRDFAAIAIEALYGQTGFFIVGGETFDRVPLNSVWFYNVLRKSWERKAPLKTGRYGFAAALVNNEIWIGGGIAYTGNPNCIESSGDISTRSYSEFITDTIERYNLESAFKNGEKSTKHKLKEQWIQSKQRLRQPCLFGRFCITKKNELFLIGGIGRHIENDLSLSSFNTIDRFDFKAEKWLQCGILKTERHGHDVALIDDCIAVIGGVSSKKKCALNDIEFFSTKTLQTIQHIPSLPWPLSGLTAVVVRGEW